VDSGIVEPASHQQAEEENKKRQTALTRSRLVQRLVAAAPDLPAFINDLITAQATTVSGTEAAGFTLESDGKGGMRLVNVAHVRHDDSSEEVRANAIKAFAEIVKPCLQRGMDGAIKVGGATPEQPEPQFCLVTLLRGENEVQAVSAVIARCRTEELAQQRLESMRLVAAFYDLYGLRRSNEASKLVAASHQDVLQFAAAFATADGFQQGSANLCNELAAKMGASRVSLGWVHRHREGGSKVKLKALSHTEEFDKRQELSTQIVKAMEECVDAEEVVQFDPTGQASTANVQREAAALSRLEGGSRVVSLPLRRKTGDVIGVMTLEFPVEKPATPQETTSLAVAADLLAPQLHDRYQNDRYLITKAGLSAKELGLNIIRPRYVTAKLIAGAVIGLLLFVTLYRPMYQVKAPFTLVAESKYTISSPLENGVIKDVLVEPRSDQVVEAGTVLLKFETFDLEKQKQSAVARKAQAEIKRQQALAAPGRDKAADARIAAEEIKEADADINYFDSQIARATIKAPITGIVLSGDLKDRRGATVKLGDTLFEMAPADAIRVDLFVPERDIQRVATGSVGQLSTSSMPGVKHDFKVTRVVPAAEPRQNATVYRVQAEIASAQAGKDWLPGMEGEARIDVEKKPLIWIWTHRLTEFVQMKLWL
jgi:multidrug resistance efflux pump